MPDPDFLTSMGIRVSDVMAGAAGGIVNAFVFKRSNPVAVTGSIVVGALTANYLGGSASRLMEAWVSPSATVFIVGLCGMGICQAIADAVSRWKPKLGGAPDV